MKKEERGERMGKVRSFMDQPLRIWLNHLLEEVRAQREEGNHPGLVFLLEQILNACMDQERRHFLENLAAQKKKDYANGYYPRKLHLAIGTLNLKVPRVRFSRSFRPSILPGPWQRTDQDYEELLLAMLANGYSHAQIQRALKKLGLPFSQETLNDVQEIIQEKLNFFKTQPLKSDWFAIFIDAYWTKLRTETGKVEEIALFVAVGIDLEGNKEILGFWVHKGRETKAFWVEVLQDLIQRGVHRVLLFVTDDFRGVHDVIHSLFPDADHQICLLHVERNLRNALPTSLFREARKCLRKIRFSQDVDEGQLHFDKLVQEVEKAGRKNLAASLRQKQDRILAFLKYPEEVRRHIYTTNVVESLNAGIERMRIELGGYFPSLKALEVNLFIQMVNHHDRWLKRTVPTIQAHAYKLRQIFALRFGLDDPSEVLHNF